jgi:hypothetical protein
MLVLHGADSAEVKCRWFLGLASASVAEDARRRLLMGGLSHVAPGDAGPCTEDCERKQSSSP